MCRSKCGIDKCEAVDPLEVRTLRCGRNNPGSNPGHGILFAYHIYIFRRLA